MKVYPEGVNVAVDRGAPYTIEFIPVSDSRLLDQLGDQIGIFDEETNQTYQEDFSLITDKAGASYGGDKDAVLVELAKFVGDTAGDGGGGTGIENFRDLLDVDSANLRDGSVYVWDNAASKLKPSNVIEKAIRIDGSTDGLFYSDEHCEMRWLASGHPQFRVKGAWNWLDAGILSGS